MSEAEERARFLAILDAERARRRHVEAILRDLTDAANRVLEVTQPDRLFEDAP